MVEINPLEHDLFLVLCEIGSCLAYCFPVLLYAVPVFSRMCRSSLHQRLEGTPLQISGAFSLGNSSFLYSSPQILAVPAFPNPTLSQFLETIRFWLDSPSLHSRLGIASRQKTGANVQLTLVVSFFQGLWSCAAFYPMSENLFHILFCSCLRWESKSSHCYSIMAGSRSCRVYCLKWIYASGSQADFMVVFILTIVISLIFFFLPTLN